MVIASGVIVPYHAALAQRYVMANGRVQHFTDEQMRWLEDLRPKVLLAEKQRAFQESISAEQECTDDLMSPEDGQI